MSSKQRKYGPTFAVPSYVVKVRGECGCSVMSSADGADAQAACYLASRPAGVVDITYSEHCGHCRGAGRVSKNRRWKSCPACAGAPEITPETHVVTHTAVSA